MAEQVLAGVDDVVGFIDQTIYANEDNPAPCFWANAEVLELLGMIRAGLVDRPEWSEVVESNLLADVAAARRELAAHQLQADLAAELFMSAIRNVAGQRDRARRTAVVLEQELAETQAKLDRWLNGERAL